MPWFNKVTSSFEMNQRSRAYETKQGVGKDLFYGSVDAIRYVDLLEKFSELFIVTHFSVTKERIVSRDTEVEMMGIKGTCKKFEAINDNFSPDFFPLL